MFKCFFSMSCLPEAPRLCSFWRRIAVIACMAAFTCAPCNEALAASRLKDLVDFEGVRNNMLVGYGLVVGLNGTGDSLTNSPFTEKSLIGMLERLGVNTRGDSLKTKNVAAVMVTSILPPFAAQGTKLDVTVSTLGDAKDLQGGTLVVTPLIGADGEVYAVSQGPVATSGFSASGEATTVTKGVPTSGRISNGAIVEREIPFRLADLGSLRISLRNPDFTTSRRIAKAINVFLKAPAAEAVDPATVRLLVPDERQRDVVSLITDIEQIMVEPDQVAKVIINEQSGVIVMGENVRIDTVAIAQGNLTIKISEAPQVSQPAPLSQGGQTVAVPRTDINVNESEGNKVALFRTGASLQEVVQGMNALGIGPRDMITILQSIKAAGALQAELEVI